jgi:hypothetical protein
MLAMQRKLATQTTKLVLRRRKNALNSLYLIVILVCGVYLIYFLSRKETWMTLTLFAAVQHAESSFQRLALHCACQIAADPYIVKA